MTLPDLQSATIAIIGLGYVGLPLAIEFSRTKICHRSGKNLFRSVIGFDVDKKRISLLKHGCDVTNEVSVNELRECENIIYTTDENALDQADVYIVTVPTPVDNCNNPDFSYLESASSIIGSSLKRRFDSGAHSTPLLIYESTVFPGATEEICIPVVEKMSGMRLNLDFFCGYSPERINPGDRINTLTKIVKVTSGSTPESAAWIDNLYGSIIKAGTHKASCLRVAEASKVIENVQRDVNIALINELSVIFKNLNVDTLDVLGAASSKWNFLPFRPGLVGGHCIGVDPYYLTYKCEQLGYYPQVILAARRINDAMGRLLADKLVLEICKSGQSLKSIEILVMGFTFKEDCPDIRNTRVVDFVKALTSYGANITIYDPLADADDCQRQHQLKVLNALNGGHRYFVVVAAVAHSSFIQYSVQDWSSLVENEGILFDIKGIIPRELNPLRI